MSTTAKHRLTHRGIIALKAAPAGSRYEVMDTEVPGLGVRVTDKGYRTFILAGRFPSSPHYTRRELAVVDSITLEQAREKAREWRQLIRAGIDPSEQQKQQLDAAQRKRECSFAVVAEDFIQEKLPSERKGKEVERAIRREFMEKWGRKPISEITETDVLFVIRLIKARAPMQARNVLGFAKRFFQWAIDQRVYEIKLNPCVSLKPDKIIGEKKSRSRILSDDELRAFMRAAKRMGYPYGALYRLLLLTGLRLNEVADASWREFDFDNGIWIIPAERMKGRNHQAREHVVPITAEIKAVLDGLPRFKSGRFLFSNDFGVNPVWMTTKAKDRLDAQMLRTLRALARAAGHDPAGVELKPFVNHDLRRTLRTGLSALRIDRDVREAVLAHTLGGIEGVYDRHDYLAEKKHALERWAERLRNIEAPTRPSNIVPLRGAQA
jgi:integrase